MVKVTESALQAMRPFSGKHQLILDAAGTIPLIVGDADKFDPAFFNISRAEAEVMDPQHRLFLQAAWHCLEDAGYAPSSFSDRRIAPTSVYGPK